MDETTEAVVVNKNFHWQHCNMQLACHLFAKNDGCGANTGLVDCVMQTENKNI